MCALLPLCRAQSQRHPSRDRRVTTKPSVDVLIQQAHLAHAEGRRDSARTLFESALYRLRRAQDGALAASLLRWIGATHHDDGNTEAALDCLTASLTVALLVDDHAEIGHTMNVQANVYRV